MNTKSILIVEDDISIRDTLEIVLKEETAYKVFVASDGKEALDLLQVTTPDLFLLDYWLPGMNGTELIDCIREYKRYQHTPIVIMSASQSWAKSPRNVRYLAKPFELDDFLHVVEEAIVD